MREVKEEINCVLESRIDRAYEAWYASEKEQMFRAVDDVIGDGTLEVPVPDMSRETIYDDEPKTEKEVEAHKECAEIRKAAWKEIQQLIEMSVGVLLDERQAQAIEKDKKVQVLRSKMVYKRKYEISPTRERILLEVEGEVGGRGLHSGAGCRYCMEYVLAYDRFYSHSDVDSDDVQSQVVR